MCSLSTSTKEIFNEKFPEIIGNRLYSLLRCEELLERYCDRCGRMLTEDFAYCDACGLPVNRPRVMNLVRVNPCDVDKAIEWLMKQRRT
jgi:uncharacterized OB-fold protein